MGYRDESSFLKTCGAAIAVLFCLALFVVLPILSYGLGWFGEAAQVMQEEFGPRAMLKKYEWFKDAAAQLDKKRADLQIYEAQLAELKAIPRKERDRQDKTELNQMTAERIGVASSYNQLAAEYNASMAKINYRFCNVGDLPPGASEPLPREFASYTTH